MADNASTAVADSVQLHCEIEGPGGGPATREQVQRAVDYYAMNYARYTPEHPGCRNSPLPHDGR